MRLVIRIYHRSMPYVQDDWTGETKVFPDRESAQRYAKLSFGPFVKLKGAKMMPSYPFLVDNHRNDH